MGFLKIRSVAKLKGDLLVQSKKFRKKSHSAEKIQVKNTKIAIGRSLVCFRGSGRRFRFRRSSDVFSMFWTWIVQADIFLKSGPEKKRKGSGIFWFTKRTYSSLKNLRQKRTYSSLRVKISR